MMLVPRSGSDGGGGGDDAEEANNNGLRFWPNEIEQLVDTVNC